MAYSDKERIDWTDVSAAANKTGDAIDVRNVACGAFSLVWTGLSAADAVIKLQDSLDGLTGWGDISGKTVTLATTPASAKIKLTKDELLCPYIRVVLTKNSETTGTVTVRYFFKGAR